MGGKRFVIGPHLLAEQGVDELDHARLAAEVQRQRQAALGGQFLAEPAEDVRIGPAEAINRLLGVAHEEEHAVGHAAVAQGPHQFDLQGIGVLKLVDQEQPRLGGEPLPQIFVFRAGQEVAGADQQVVEIEGRQFILSSPIGIGQAVRDRQQAEGRFRCGQGGLRIELRLRSDLVDRLAKFFGRVAKGLVNRFARPCLLAAAGLARGPRREVPPRPLRVRRPEKFRQLVPE